MFDDSDDKDKENQSSCYNTKSEIERDVIYASALRTIEAKKKTTTGRVPHKWFPNELARISSTKAGSYMKITINDTKNRMRAIENKEKKASIAKNTTNASLTDSALPNPLSYYSTAILCCVDPLPVLSTTPSEYCQIFVHLRMIMLRRRQLRLAHRSQSRGRLRIRIVMLLYDLRHVC